MDNFIFLNIINADVMPLLNLCNKTTLKEQKQHSNISYPWKTPVTLLGKLKPSKENKCVA